MKTRSPIAALLALTLAAPLFGADQSLPDAPKPQNAPVLNFTVAKTGSYDVPQPGKDALRITLDEAILLGIRFNSNYVVSQLNERAISGLKLTALNALIPSLSASAQTSTQQLNLAAMGFKPSVVAPLLPPGMTLDTIVKVDTTSAQLNLSQQLFNLPAFEVYRASRATAEVATYNALLTRADVVQTVATQYLRVLADLDAVHNAEAQQKSDAELTRQADESHRAGVGTNLDYLRARVELQQRDQELVKAQNDFDKDKIQLNRLMGLPATQELILSDAIPYHDLDQLPLEEAKRVAAVRRKDLLSLQAQLRSAELIRRGIRYERLPAVHVNGYYGVLGETRGLYHGVFSATAGLDFPIFQEARIRGDVKTADAQLASLRSRVAGLQQDIEAQIRSSKMDVDSYSALVKVARSNVELSQEALQQTRDRYRAGVDDDLPVVQAQATLADAQARLIASMFQYNQAKLSLARSIGVVETQYQKYLGQ